MSQTNSSNPHFKGISKGARTVELKKKRNRIKKDKVTEKIENDNFYAYLITLITCVVLFLTVTSHLFDKQKEKDSASVNRAKFDVGETTFTIYKPQGEELEPVLKVKLGLGIPKDLKPEICTCNIFESELLRNAPTATVSPPQAAPLKCVACLDWAYRSNLRIYLESSNSDSEQTDVSCYQVKWQSYDSLFTPFIDCILADEKQWYGLGDIQSSSWPLDTIQSESTPLLTNLTAEFLSPDAALSDLINQINFGSFVEYTLHSTRGVYIGDIKTDFEPAIKFNKQSETGAKRICLSASCTDKCTRSWLRDENLNEYSTRNNLLEYRICTAGSQRRLIERKLKERSKTLGGNFELDGQPPDLSSGGSVRTLLSGPSSGQGNVSRPNLVNLGETKITSEQDKSSSVNQGQLPIVKQLEQKEYPSGIGLIERTIFATSLEFMQTLDGQVLRQYVDNIVKLDLKTSSILLIDSRWETYVGSLTLDSVAFPRPKLLFEILHNKGFKIILTVKPYIDAAIGIGNLNQLFDAGRLYKASSVPRDAHFRSGSRTKGAVNSRGSVLRRYSLFKFENVTIEVGSNDTFRFPYLYKCKESREKFCVLLDLNQFRNRAWLIANIKRSNLLSDADGILLGGSHPNRINWDDHYRKGMSALALELYYKEKLFIIPQWTGDLGYIQLAPRPFDWSSLKSIVGSIINLNSLGFSLVHPGSVWGDLKTDKSVQTEDTKIGNRISNLYGALQPEEKAHEELSIRWLQVAVFLPILQFNNMAPIQRFGLNEMLQNLVRLRRQFLVPEMKKNLPPCPLVGQNKTLAYSIQLPLIRPIVASLTNDQEILAPDQFSIGPDVIVAPILAFEQRQRDIFLPVGIWRDELRGTSVRGGKWLRNYSVDLLEIPWFVREKRR